MSNTSKLILDLHGHAAPGSPCLPHGRGYYGYLCSDDRFVIRLMKSICIWCGPTKEYNMVDGSYWQGYEIDCRDKQLLMSDTFKRICHRNNIELVIVEVDKTEMRKFFDNVKR